VFLLLETVYSSLDALAKRRKVFKIETIGDCYVAVCGVPMANKDHAVIMARFARDVHTKMHVLMRDLEVALGPDTADLAFRIGLHSGAVTGGVLRGDNARFQLFGDSMNTTSRIESTGARNRTHISKQTADLLVAAGKTHWIKSRDETIVAKGLGELETFWLVIGAGKERHPNDNASVASSALSVALSVQSDGQPLQLHALTEVNVTVCTQTSKKMARLIEWNIDVLLRLLKQIAAARGESPSEAHAEHVAQSSSTMGKTVLDEVREIITLPKFDAEAAERQEDFEEFEINHKAIDQLSSFVACIAAMYQDNPFHNFEHASHVTMSVNKLLSRIVAPPDLGGEDDGSVQALTLHDHTYGITSDPLTQFACVFSAMIHDADHQGVPNTQLVAEKTELAEFYKGRSVAEQNSVDLAWGLLMGDDYGDLRAAIYNGEGEKKRFRQLVVNSVMATDIMDKELKVDRNARWSKAFSEHAGEEEESPTDAVNRKATIVIEHLIQASDVSHTMQHWHIYRKWNERLFKELYKSYVEGRSTTDPSTNWYKGELGFFDFYIIPLAKKLNECGVFGVSSDEYLNYAMRNRGEWERKGMEVIETMKAQVAAQELDEKHLNDGADCNA
jgi:class 3 adenylate cyclase